MTLGFGQILIILFFGLLLFGNLPKIFSDLTEGVAKLKQIDKKSSDVKQDSNS
jgi:Sec-independent protein translocase protein TatA|tara:strand:+ start:324 stop:482 length:159 start_codon:yes stop_codon:yes gene_type:complete